jgi:hypothetical protein
MTTHVTREQGQCCRSFTDDVQDKEDGQGEEEVMGTEEGAELMGLRMRRVSRLTLGMRSLVRMPYPFPCSPWNMCRRGMIRPPWM